MSERSLDEVAAALERLAAGLKDLDRRVATLEHTNPHLAPSSAFGDFLAGPVETRPILERETLAVAIGKGVLGIAGAYLLRAVAESGVLPFRVAVALAIIYSAAWLVTSMRASRAQTAGAFAATSILILIPMLWETTVRFRTLPASTTAVILAAFVAAGLALARRSRAGQIVVWIATLPPILAALALLRMADAVTPFTAALLAMALVVEIGAAQRTGLRIAAAIAANLALLNPQAPDMAVIFQITLLAIYASSAGVRILILKRTPAIIDMWQPLIAFWFLAPSVATCAVVAVLGVAVAEAHGAAYLIAAMLLAGLPRFSMHALAGTPGTPPIGAWIVCAAALLAYWRRRDVVALGISTLAVTSLAASALPTLPTARTILLCAGALALDFAGRRFFHTDLRWTARAIVAACAVKLLVDDFRHASAAGIALSLLSFGLVLILIPRKATPVIPVTAPLDQNEGR